MPIEFNCESCSKLLRVPDGSAGKQCQCPGCGTLLEIPSRTIGPRPNGPPPNGRIGTNGPIGESDDALCIPCPKCTHELKCAPSLVGTKGQCRNCKHIFTISDGSTGAKAPTAEGNLVFSCPKCNQLFEGSEKMRGKRGKCHACGEVFVIELRVAEQLTTQPERSYNDDLGLAETPSATTILSSSSREAAAKQTTAAKNATAPRENVVVARQTISLPPIRFSCSRCSGLMEVPGSAARELTLCPHCNQQLTIPSKSQTPAQPVAVATVAAPEPASDPWAGLGPLGGAPMPQQPYAPYSPSVRSSGSSRDSRATQYIIVGIFITIFGVILLLFSLLRIGGTLFALTYVKIPDSQTGYVMGVIAGQIVGALLAIVIAIIQLSGGIAMVRRTGLSSARAAAVVSCLPCLCLNFPFGIWACVLVYGRNAARDFNE